MIRMCCFFRFTDSGHIKETCHIHVQIHLPTVVLLDGRTVSGDTCKSEDTLNINIQLHH